MAKPSPLYAFPEASVTLAPQVLTDNVEDLKNWVWMVKRWRIHFDLSFTFGTGDMPDPTNLNMDDWLFYTGSQYDGDGSVIRAPYVDEKEMLDYRPAIQHPGDVTFTCVDGEASPGFCNTSRQASFQFTIGSPIKWGDVFDGFGVPITSGGDYGFYCNIRVSVTSDAQSGTCSTEDLGFGPISTPDAFIFDGKTAQLYGGSLTEAWSGTITVTPEEDWTFT